MRYKEAMTKTNSLLKLSCPVRNEYQGPDIRALCVCSVGMLRSPTLANILLGKGGYNVRACGSEVSMALIPISANLVHWADKIFFVNSENFQQALDVFRGTPEETMIKQKAVIFNIEDSHDYNAPALIRALNQELIIHDIN